jgi:sialate O-acetylesterase
MALEGTALRLTFRDADGLTTRDGKPPSWFEVIDAEEGGFEPATARIEGPSVVVSAPGVPRPVAVRFAWSMLAEPNLRNGAGLPVGAFRAGTIPKRDLLALKVPESRQYETVYDLDLSKAGAQVPYELDRSAALTRPFDRVAYFLELTGPDHQTQFVFVSMDAFTDNPKLLGVPTAASGIRWQRQVANLNVISNVKGVTPGQGLAAGNLEFWPSNYGTANSASVPNASGSVYDSGDQPDGPAEGYGSMQIHAQHPGGNQTLLAVNHWREGQRADLGIGNQAGQNPDWTFAANAGAYPTKRLRVLVRLR